jgi:uncharacterized peroxidase-related enzyme
MAHIKIIEHHEAEGELIEIYDHLVETRGKLAEVHKIQSLNPKSIVNHMDLYMTIMFGKSPLKRYQREMLGVVVSRANNCAYCQKHHLEALNFYWKDDEKAEKFRNNYQSVELNPTDSLLCDYAHHLTVNPTVDSKNKFIDPLKDFGLSDRAILDATLIISYFNFVNRMVLGLGVNLEQDGGSGYKY